jgi:hypothetical protein
MARNPPEPKVAGLRKRMQITAKDIEAKKTKNGGWTRKQLAEWGVPWPPPKGWKNAPVKGGNAVPPSPIDINIEERVGNAWQVQPEALR